MTGACGRRGSPKLRMLTATAKGREGRMYREGGLQPVQQDRPTIGAPHAALVSSHSQHKARVHMQMGCMPCLLGAQHVSKDGALLRQQHWLVCICDQAENQGALPSKSLLVAVQSTCRVLKTLRLWQGKANHLACSRCHLTRKPAPILTQVYKSGSPVTQGQK